MRALVTRRYTTATCVCKVGITDRCLRLRCHGLHFLYHFFLFSSWSDFLRREFLFLLSGLHFSSNCTTRCRISCMIHGGTDGGLQSLGTLKSSCTIMLAGRVYRPSCSITPPQEWYRAPEELPGIVWASYSNATVISPRTVLHNHRIFTKSHRKP